MSVRKEVSITIDKSSSISLITGTYEDKNKVLLQAWWEGHCYGVVLDPNHLKSLIESLEDIYYKIDIPDVHQLFEQKENIRSQGCKEPVIVFAESEKQHQELVSLNCEKDAHIASLETNLKAETGNVTVLLEKMHQIKLDNSMELSKQAIRINGLKEMNEKLIAENDVLRKKVLESKGNKQLRKKHTKAIQELKNMECLAAKTERHLNEYQKHLKEAIESKNKFESECIELRQKLSTIEQSGRVYYEGSQVGSYGLALVADERIKHFKKGVTIEKDVIRNFKNELSDAAIFCLTCNENDYPTGWNDKFKHKVGISNVQDRLKFAAALIIAELDRREYVTRKNNLFENR